MDSSNNQSPDDDEMGRLVSIAAEEFGLGLTRNQFNEVMLALFEHIAGLKRSRRQRLIGISASSGQSISKPFRQIAIGTDMMPASIPTWNAARPSQNLYHSIGTNWFHPTVMHHFPSHP
jgi:hypothetical protein